MSGSEVRTLATLILAGGRSRRMGRDKATLELDDEPLVARQARVLREASVRTERAFGVRLADPRLSRAPGQPDPAPELGLPILWDPEPEGDDPHRGPLAGIVTGLEALDEPGTLPRPDALLVLAVDMPAVGPRLLEELVEAWLDAGADRTVAPWIDGRWEPLCAIWAPEVLPEARRRLRTEPLSPTALLDALDREGRVRRLELSADRAAELGSWNRPAEARSAEPRDPDRRGAPPQ